MFAKELNPVRRYTLGIDKIIYWFHLIGIKVTKCSEGLHNKAFDLLMDNGSEVFAKLPNPNAGPTRLAIASEVATRELIGQAISSIDIGSLLIFKASQWVQYAYSSNPGLVLWYNEK